MTYNHEEADYATGSSATFLARLREIFYALKLLLLLLCSSVMLRAAHFINVIRKRKVCVVCMVHLITISSSSKMKMNHSRCAIATAQSKTTF